MTSQAVRLQTRWNAAEDHRWAVILAGGDGKRLLPFTRRISGDDRPKQFCSILSGDTLLAETQQRVGLVADPRKTLLIVTRTHERFYAGHVAAPHSTCLLEQPYNRGTAPAILYALMRIRELDTGAVVTFFPSDHHFTDDGAFVAHVQSAFASAESLSDRVLLLGIEPSTPEVDYGWIQPGTRMIHAPAAFHVRRFWEKPSFALASALMKRGCLWNSFVMVGSISSFVHLIGRALPNLLRSFEAIQPALFTGTEREALSDLYSGIATVSFSEAVLSPYPWELAVLPCGKLGWSDLGDAGRVLSVLRRNRCPGNVQDQEARLRHMAVARETSRPRRSLYATEAK